MALSPRALEVTIADEFGPLLVKPTKASISGVFQTSAATVQRDVVEITLFDNSQLDCLFTLWQPHSALAVARRRTASGPDNITTAPS